MQPVNLSPVKLAIIGLGTVGGGALRLLQQNASEIARRTGREIVITRVGIRRPHPDFDLSNITTTDDLLSIARADDVDIVIELMGGTTTANDVVREAIKHGKHVITANKALLAEQGNELFDLAEKAGVKIAYEAAVAGGIPIIKVLREGLAANRIEWLAGIINGTGNFILSEMREKGRAFADVLAEAQALGYAEADPTFDVEGIDAAHKLTILASNAFGIPLQFDKVYCEGITKLTAQDVSYAEELGYRIKHLGIARRTDAGIELRVHPTLIPTKRLIANVNGVKNAVLVKSDAVGATLYYGAGAGAGPTASAVVADVIDMVRSLSNSSSSAQQISVVPHLAFLPNTLADTQILSAEQMVTAYYLRINAADEPGVLAEITQIISRAGINIDAVLQKPSEHLGRVPVVLLTQPVLEQKMNTAIAQIEALPAVGCGVVRIRLEDLDG